MTIYRYFFTWFLLTATIMVQAAEAPYVKELKGAAMVPGNTLLVMDEKLNPEGNALISDYVSIDDVISFDIDFGTNAYFYNQSFTATLDYTLIRYKTDLPDEVLDSVQLSLAVQFKFDGGSYKGVGLYKFRDSRKFMVRIRNISSPELSPLLPIFRLRSQIIINRKFIFEPVSTDTIRFQKTGNQLRLSWKPFNFKGAEEFDLEYTYIDKESATAIRYNWQPDNVYSIPTDTLNKWFTNNSSRIVTDSSTHTINMINSNSFILFRIRHVQYTKTDDVRMEGDWNYSSMELDGMQIGVGLVYNDWHEPDLNWQYTISFAEQGKKKEVISYFDGSLRNRQSVTINNSDNVSVVQENIYDRLGRAVVNILPAPTNDNTLHYFKGFNLNASNAPYSYLDIADGVRCGNLVMPMSSSAGASRYYSPNNSFINQLDFVKHIADASLFPFAATEYTNDNTGRIKAQGGVGADFQLNAGKDTRYYYGKPTQTELDRLFGSEAGDASHYLKNMVMDPNGQVSVSYVNASGKTIATALAGNAPANLEALPSNTAGVKVPFSNDIIRPVDFNTNAADYSISASSSFMAPLPGNYTINYDVSPLRLSTLFGQKKDSVICSTCYYDLLITVKNDCDSLLYSFTSAAGQPFDTSCTSPGQNLSGSRVINVNRIGEYNVSYALKVSKAALDYYDLRHLEKNTEIRKYNDFVRDELVNANFYGCFSECATCNDKLGTKANFINRFRDIYDEQNLTFAAADSATISVVYDSLYANCQAIQTGCSTQQSPCAEKLDLLKQDVKPGGQYALYDSAYRLVDLQTNVLLSRSQIVFFTDENGKRDSITLVNISGEDSVRLDVKSLSDSLFITYFKDSWADSLVKFHKEYCFYKWCVENSASYTFDRNIENLIDGDQAVSQGYYNRSFYNALLSTDPFFNSANGSAYKKFMDSSLAKFSRIYMGYAVPDKNILQFVDYALYCKEQTDPNINCTPDIACRSVNREWEMYKRFYLNLKQQYYEKSRQSNIAYAGCSNCFIGQDIFQPISDPSADSCISVSFQKSLGGQGVDNPLDIISLSDGGNLIVGKTTSFGVTGQDAYLTKTDHLGNIVWTKTIGGAGNDYFSRVKEISDKGFIAIGTTNSFTNPSGNSFIARFDKNGNVIWTKEFNISAPINNQNLGRDIGETSSGDFVFMGELWRPGYGRPYLGKLNASGQLISARLINTPGNSEGLDLAILADTVFVSGHHYGSSGSWWDGMLIKMNHNDYTSYWSKYYDIDNRNNYGYGISIKNKLVYTQVTSFPNISNFAVSFVSLVAHDFSGNIRFAKTVNPISDTLVGYALPMNSGDFVYALNDISSLPTGDSKLALMRFDSSGNISWKYRYNTPGIFNTQKLTENNDGDIIAVGDYKTISTANNDMFYFRTNASGTGDSCGRIVPNITLINSVSNSLPFFFTSNPVITGLSNLNVVSINATMIDSALCKSICFKDTVFKPFSQTNLREQRIQSIFGNSNTSVLQSSNPTTDGGMILTGLSYNGPILLGSLAVKTDSSGFISWSKFFPGEMALKNIKQTSNNEFIAIGTTTLFPPNGSVLVGNPDFPLSLAFVTKLDSLGNNIWARTIYPDTLSIYDYVEGIEISETPEGNYVLFSSSLPKHFITRISSSGSIQSNVTINNLLREELFPFESGFNVKKFILVSDTVFLVGNTGYRTSDMFSDFNWFMKYNYKTDSVYWVKYFDFEVGDLVTNANKISYKDGNLIGGYNWSDSTDKSVLFSLDHNGTLLFSYSLNSGSDPYNRLNVLVTPLKSGEYVGIYNNLDLIGFTVFKFNKNGNVLFSAKHNLEKQVFVNGISELASGDLVVSGNFNGSILNYRLTNSGTGDQCFLQESSVTLEPFNFNFASGSISHKSSNFIVQNVGLNTQNIILQDSTLCGLRPAKFDNCPPGIYRPFDQPNIKHNIVKGRPDQIPTSAAGYNGWKYYNAFFLKTTDTTQCLFENVWVASCDKPVPFTCPSVADFSTSFTTPLCENGTKLSAYVRYNGTQPLPANSTITVTVSYDGSGIQWNGSFDLINGSIMVTQCSPYLTSAGGNITKTITGVFCNIPAGDTSCFSETFPASYCSNDTNSVHYKDKIRRFPEYVNLAELVNTVSNTSALNKADDAAASIKTECAGNCDAQADYWINVLSNCSSDSLKLKQLRAALVEICSLGCTGTSIFGSSSIPASISTPYHSFEEAIIGILGPQAISATCTEELLSNPYPYDKQPVYTQRQIIETDRDICNKISQFQAEYAVSGFSGSFYRWMDKILGNSMTLDSIDLADILNACTSCNNILKNDQLIPAAFDKNSTALTCTLANTMLNGFNQKFNNLSTDDPNYEILFMNYFNHRLGFSLSYDDYRNFLDSCNAGIFAKLYDRPMQETVEPGENDCLKSVFVSVLTNARFTYTSYIDSVRKDFRDAYLGRCLNVNARVKMTADLYEYHYTLYYYDQSGNLVKTVPPAGVDTLSRSAIDAVQKTRTAENAECFNGQDEVRFQGTNHYTFANILQYRPGNSAFSLEAWIKFRSYTSQGILSLHNQGTGNAYGLGYILQIRNDSLIFRVGGATTNIFLEARGGKLSQLVPDTNWRHLVIEKTNSFPAVRIFINGTAIPLSIISSNFDNTTLINPSASLRIGGSPIPIGSQHFNGSIKQFRTYLRALPVAEVKQNYFNACFQPANTEGLNFWTLMNDGTGRRIRNLLRYDSASITGGTINWFSNRSPKFPAHKLATTYEYNTFNQVRLQFSPDGDTTLFWYDRLGRLVASQNMEQRKEVGPYLDKDRYSYTKYDYLGRITEVGERINLTGTPRSINFLDTIAVKTWLSNGETAQITKTLYDYPIYAFQSATTSRKRVAASIYIDYFDETIGDSTLYAYDILGNVKILLQHNRELVTVDDFNGKKRIDYQFDLISGKVNKVVYQGGKGDQFIYRYDYDADNRITQAYSSRDGLIWINDASYIYHLHGPLARTELGELKVQGLDYAYTLQGWLKGMNGTSLADPNFDMGRDGKTGSQLPIVARDALGFMLDYYKGDYKPIGLAAFNLNHFASPANTLGTNFRDLYNGNITGMLTNIKQFNEPQYNNYRYDQLNRLKSQDIFRGMDEATNNWATATPTQDYKEVISYDANGNILSYLRNGKSTAQEVSMDNLIYNYLPGTNKLGHVTDSVFSSPYTEDIETQASGNYRYDRIGNLKSDTSENIQSISWTVYGKIKNINKTNPVNNTATSIQYRYDAAGNRIFKSVTETSYGTQSFKEDQTFYVRDAQGNVLAVYEKQNEGTTVTPTLAHSGQSGLQSVKVPFRFGAGFADLTTLRWTEQHLYGSSRLGIWKYGEEVPAAAPNANPGQPLEDSLTYGDRYYELSNHLGNVLASITDKKKGFDEGSNNTTDYFLADIASAQDYYPGGMTMPGRKYSGGNLYRYGFNGKENDNEVKGEGNQQDYGMRIYDPRLVRFLSVDPISAIYPELTPYQFAENSPILFIDLDGLEKALPWYLRENKHGGKPVLTLGLGNLPTTKRIENYENLPIPAQTKAGIFAINALKSAWNGIANTWNDGMDGKTGTDMFRETIQGLEKVKPSDFKKVETWENLAGAAITIYISKRLFSFEFSPTATKTISGKWVSESTKGWSARAIEFQEHVTGVKAGNALEINGVKFDGVRGNTLLEAKNGYNNWVSRKTGEFYNSFKGKDGLLNQARRQLDAANGADLEWHFSNQKALDATKSLFEKNGIKEGIKYVLNPPK